MDKADELLPNYDRVIFNNAALALVLAQLKYPPIQRFTDEQYMVGIREALSIEYPLVSTEQGVNIVISPEGVRQSPGASMLRFTSIDSSWSVVLSSESVSLEARNYTNIKDMSERFANILQQIETHFRPRHQLRFGLRYINEFRHPQGDTYQTWNSLLNRQLLGLGARNVLGGNIEQTIGEILTQRDDGYVLVRHGFLKGSTVVPTTTYLVRTGPFYLLDLDYYDETPVKFEVEGPIERMGRYNASLYRIFRWAIGDGELFRYLKG